MLGRLLVVALTVFPSVVRACDLCGCYSPQVESMPKENISLTGFYTAIAEQFTNLGSLQFDDREVANPSGNDWKVRSRNSSSATKSTTGSLCNLTRRLFIAISGGRKALPSTKAT